MKKYVLFLSSLALACSSLSFHAGATTPNEHFLEATKSRQETQAKLDLKKLPASTLAEMVADSLQRVVVLQQFVKDSPTGSFNDVKLVGKANVLLPKIQELSRTQYAAMQNATFIEQKANVEVSVAGEQNEVLQYTAANFNQAARDYLLKTMRTNDLIKQMGFKSVAFMRDGSIVEKINL